MHNQGEEWMKHFMLFKKQVDNISLWDLFHIRASKKTLFVDGEATIIIANVELGWYIYKRNEKYDYLWMMSSAKFLIAQQISEVVIRSPFYWIYVPYFELLNYYWCVIYIICLTRTCMIII